jgi:NRPS condensation-like uncharacterized protein
VTSLDNASAVKHVEVRTMSEPATLGQPQATLVHLNRSEHLYLACEGHVGGSIIQPYLLRFDRQVALSDVRQALRELTSAYPRLRGIVVPSGWTYKLQILPDDAGIDQLFEDAVRVVHGVDAASASELETCHSAVLNEPLSMERGLPWRARYIPHAEQPALIFALHHIAGDGRSLVQMISAIVGRLNGHPIAPCPLQSPSMVKAVTPAQWHQWPASIFNWWRNHRADVRASRGQTLVMLNSRESSHFTTSRIHHHELPCGQAQLRAVAKQMGTTVNNLMTALIANCFLARAADKPNAVAAIRISVDLRRHFPKDEQPEVGNFVSSFAVRATHQCDLPAQIRSIETQVKAHLARYERREYALPLLLYEALPWMGRTLYSRFIVASKAKGKLRDVSCHFTNLGSAESVHPADPTVRLTHLWPATLGVSLVLVIVSLGDKLYLPVIQQLDETDADTVKAFLAALDVQLQSLIQA